MKRYPIQIDQAAYEEGRQAAEQGRHFNTDCPYLFCAVKVSQEEFEQQYRAKMNGWFQGWHDWLREHGLGYDFSPIGSGRRWTENRRKAQPIGAKR